MLTRFFSTLVLVLAVVLTTGLLQTPVQAGSGSSMLIATNPAPPIFTGLGNTNNERATRYSIANIRDTLLPAIARWGGGFIGAVAVLALIWAGILFLTAGGDEEKISQATKTAFYVIAALLLMMFAYVLVYLFLTIFTPPEAPPPA